MRVHVIKVNEFRLTQIESFQFFPIMRVAANAYELFCISHLGNIRAIFLGLQLFAEIF